MACRCFANHPFRRARRVENLRELVDRPRFRQPLEFGNLFDVPRQIVDGPLAPGEPPQGRDHRQILVCRRRGTARLEPPAGEPLEQVVAQLVESHFARAEAADRVDGRRVIPHRSLAAKRRPPWPVDRMEIVSDRAIGAAVVLNQHDRRIRSADLRTPGHESVPAVLDKSRSILHADPSRWRKTRVPVRCRKPIKQIIARTARVPLRKAQKESSEATRLANCPRHPCAPRWRSAFGTKWASKNRLTVRARPTGNQHELRPALAAWPRAPTTRAGAVQNRTTRALKLDGFPGTPRVSLAASSRPARRERNSTQDLRA